MALTFPDEVLRAIVADAEACYPNESCGLVFGKPGAATSAVAMKNVYDRYHKLDPERFPRSAATAYKMDELKVMTLVEEAQARGDQLVAIYHSHNDVGSYFSAEDKAVALAETGQPLWPGTEYLVVSVRKGKADVAKSFAWDGADFAGRDVPLPQAAR